MSTPTTLEDIRSAISSPALLDGALPCASQDGQTTAECGPDLALVSRFRSQASSEAMSTNDTSGPLFTASSPSAGLQWSLESKLRARLAKNGSPPYAQTWKEIAMPAGPSLSRLSVSAPPIDVTGSGSLPTPSGTSNHGKNHVAGRIDEWGGSSNYFRGTEAGRLHLPGFELWTMGFPASWRQLMPLETRSSLKSRQK
jgi:hypothetical protein